MDVSEILTKPWAEVEDMNLSASAFSLAFVGAEAGDGSFADAAFDGNTVAADMLISPDARNV